MKKTIRFLNDSGLMVATLQLVSLGGLIFTDDAKSLLVFGFIYIGACIQEK